VEHQNEAYGAREASNSGWPAQEEDSVRVSPQPEEEKEEFKTTLMHRKRKLPDQAVPPVGVVLLLKFFLCWILI